MKSGLTLTAMALELERRQAAKRDFMANTSMIGFEAREAGPMGSSSSGIFTRLNLDRSPIVDLRPGDTFRRQLSAHYKVPQDYSERIYAAHPALYAHTYNTMMHATPVTRMVRTLDGRARAFLSDRFRTLDDYDLAEAVLPTIMEHKDIDIVSSQFTESRFYLKAVFPRIQTEVKKGDPVQIGLNISNSEVGAGALVVCPIVFRLVCLNGMVCEDYGQRRYHVGKRASAEESAYEMYTDNTRRLDNAAFFAKVKDTVRGVLTQATLDTLVIKMREATEQRIEGTQIQNVVEVTAKRFAYGESTKGGILRHLIEGGDLTRYGLMNAITRQSQDEDDYETATRLEQDGARIIELGREDWTAIGNAALAKAA